MILDKLKKIRKDKGFSQEQMAKIISTDTSNYSRKERGEVRIHEDEWQKLAKALGVPVEEIKEIGNKQISSNDNPSSDKHSGGSVNYYIPNSLMENLQDYISILKKEIQNLKEENEKLRNHN